MTTWHKGPPPSVGWWPASVWRDPKSLRYYNGTWWSIPAYSEMTAKEAANFAKQIDSLQDNIEWTERPASWPEMSRT